MRQQRCSDWGLQLAQRTHPVVIVQTRLLTSNTAAQEHGAWTLQPAPHASAYPSLSQLVSQTAAGRHRRPGTPVPLSTLLELRRGRTWRARGRAACRRRRAPAARPPAPPAARIPAGRARAPAGRVAPHMTAPIYGRAAGYWRSLTWRALTTHTSRMRRHTGPRCCARSGRAGRGAWLACCRAAAPAQIEGCSCLQCRRSRTLATRRSRRVCLAASHVCAPHSWLTNVPARRTSASWGCTGAGRTTAWQELLQESSSNLFATYLQLLTVLTQLVCMLAGKHSA